jgi:hypothetical protein
MTTLRTGIVLSTTDETCTVAVDGTVTETRYAATFPRPRAERVQPGHLVALATAADGADVVVWRWFDAVVLGQDADGVTLWEPVHGIVHATLRSGIRYPPGSRAYASAGLPGADWWVAGPAVAVAEEADVDVDEVVAFFEGLGLLDGLTG